MKSDELISKLKFDIHSNVLDKRSGFLLKWSITNLIILFPVVFLLPWRENLMEAATALRFFLDNLMWLTLASVSAAIFYESLYPEVKLRGWNTLILVILILLVLSASIFSEHNGTIMQEMDLYRGRCGFIIMILSIIQTPLFFSFGRKGASSVPGMTGVYAALSSASFACLLMQLICAHDNSFHLLIWHFVPIIILSFLSFYTARKLFYW